MVGKLNKTVLMTGSFLTSFILLSGVQAFAQDTVPSTPTSQAPVEELLDIEDDANDEIVVTGSRISRDEFTSTAPVQLITSETASLSGLLSASEILQGSSVAAGSGQINNTFTGFVIDGGAGVNTVSLRGLGAQRTLVLLNGRRLGPAGVGGTVGPVDLNIIPNSAVSRFEVLKDGASSVYGSDAVAGVANVITKNNIDGLSVGGTTSITEQGGGETGAVWGSYGKSLDLVSFNVSAEYSERKALRIGDRDVLACPQDLIFDPTTGERTDAIDTRTGTFKCFNSVEGYIQTFFPDDAPFGVAGNFFGSRIPDADGTSPVPGYRFIPFQERSYDDPRQLETTAISPNKTLTLFGEATYTPTQFDNLELYTEVLYNNRQSSQTSFRQIFPYYHQDSSVNPLNATNATFTNDFCNQFSVPCGSFVAPIGGLLVRPIVLVPSNTRQNVDYIRGVAGMRGTFGDKGFLSGWNYDLNIVSSKSSAEYFQDVIPEDRLNAGTGTNQTNNSFIGVCGPTAPAGCVPLDLFNANALANGVFSQAEQDYFFVEEKGTTNYSQTVIEGVVTGDVFEAPAGTVGMAMGVSARWDSIDDTPGEFSINSNSWGRSSAGRTKGSDTVVEVFGEVEVPLVANKQFFEDLSLNASARYSDYSSVGDAFTYKVGLNWALNDMIRFRATHGTSFRAPALYELFLKDQTSFLSQRAIDPCIQYGVPGAEGGARVSAVVAANCAAEGLPVDYAGTGSSAEITRGGGLGRLAPEDSNSTSVGVVFTPKDTGFSLAVDYFKIEVLNQISSSAAGVVGQCYADSDFRSVPGFCDLFVRELDPTAANFGQIVSIDASYRNIPSQTTSGFDITTRYEHEFNFGTLDINGQFTVTEKEEFQLFEGTEILDGNGTDGEPKVVGSAQAAFRKKDWTVAWTTNYTNGTENLGYRDEDGKVDYFYSGPSDKITKVDAFITHDISVRKEWDTLTVIAGVGNIFNEEPSLISQGEGASGEASTFGNYPFSSQYFDGYLGREFFVRIDKRF